MSTKRTSLRPVADGDWEFLFQVYASTRTEELSVVPWTEEQKEAFLRFQFDAQRRYYAQHYAAASFDVIELDGQPVGRLYVDRRPAEIRLVDIAFLPQHRGHGLGGELLAEILAEGEVRGLRVTIHVEFNNPAMRLYHRLGFQKIEEQGVYHLMEWTPEALRGPAGERNEESNLDG